jgi:cold shock CspA family protein
VEIKQKEINMSYQSYKGVVKNWNPRRGFGFIRALDSGEEFYFHYADLRCEENSIRRGAYVAFDSNSMPVKGKTLAMAVNVVVVDDPRQRAGLSVLAAGSSEEAPVGSEVRS